MIRACFYVSVVVTVFLARLCRRLRWCLTGVACSAALLPGEAAGGQEGDIVAISLDRLPTVPIFAGFMAFAGFAAERTLWPRLRR